MVPYVDAHCHVTTSIKQGHTGSLRSPEAPSVRCVMSNNSYDWQRVKSLTHQDSNTKIGFGVHPWYCHLYYVGEKDCKLTKETHYKSVLQGSNTEEVDQIISRLPEPINLQEHIQAEFEATRCACIGEIGLDKLFRLPENGFFQGDERAPLSRVKVSMDHQTRVFIEMCKLAAKHSLAVSIHCVKSPSLMFELCKKHLLTHSDVNLCLHSFTGSLETLTGSWLKTFPSERLFLSFSSYINLKNDDSAAKLVKALPRECILTETDFTWDTADPASIIRELDLILSHIAHQHDLQSLQEAKELVYSNFQRFISQNLSIP
ncbi:LAFA_0D03642g1_1 [Lachancea sp. 'fantastica']|nr:LAFA_0D03642g1_1 [Lachancea sp. 'fantastica']